MNSQQPDKIDSAFELLKTNEEVGKRNASLPLAVTFSDMGLSIRKGVTAVCCTFLFALMWPCAMPDAQRVALLGLYISFVTALFIRVPRFLGMTFLGFGFCSLALGNFFGLPSEACIMFDLFGAIQILIAIVVVRFARPEAPLQLNSSEAAQEINCGSPGSGLVMTWIVFPFVVVALCALLGLAWRSLSYGRLEELPYCGALSLLPAMFAIRVLGRQYGLQLKVVCSPSGILFDDEFRNTLHGRYKRAWDDLHSVEFSGILNSEELKHSKNLVGCYLTLSFKPEGAVTLDLSKMKRSEIIKLLIQIEQNSHHSAFSKQAYLFSQIMLGAASIELDSEEQLITDSLEMQFSATHFMPLNTNTTLQDGRYSILTQLASGGMSSVYAGRTNAGNTAKNAQANIVIKESVLPFNTDEKSRAKARELFARESKMLAKLDHPQIVRVLDSFVESEREYIILEYKAGATLRQVRQRKQQSIASLIPAWAYQISQILEYLHSLEPPVMHRDLTPDNLILAEDGKIFVIDFGVSNEFIGNATGTLVGKQAYISPEQFRGKAEPKSDVYSLGATLFYLYTGNDPVALSVSDPRQNLTEIVIPDLMAELIVSMTQMDSFKRLSSSQLKERLKLVVDEQKPC